jgi:hypothetical protein
MTILPRGEGLPRQQVREFDEVMMRFGRLVVAFRPKHPAVRFSVTETHWPFIVSNAANDDCVELLCEVAPVSARTDPPTFSLEDKWDVWRAHDRSEEMIFYRGRNRLPSWRLRLDGHFRRGEIQQAPIPVPGPFRADDSPMLQYLVTRTLGRRGALLIHASMAIVDGKALVFVGHSRAGKSTIARVAESAGARIPTDDRTILTFENDRIMAWGSPWYGSLLKRTPEGAPVRAVFLLEQASENRVESITINRAIKELFVRLVQPRLDAEELETSLSRLEELVRGVNVSVLHFRPTVEAFDLAKRHAASA